MNIDRINDIEPFIIPEKYLLGEGQYVNTEWVEKNNGKIMEIEMVIDYNEIKDYLIECYISCTFRYWSLLSMLFLSKNSKNCSYKISNSKLKIKIFQPLISLFLDNVSRYSSHTFFNGSFSKNYKYLRLKRVCCDDNIFGSNCTYFNNYPKLKLQRCTDNNIRLFYNMIGLFIWIDSSKATSNDLPVIKIIKDNNKVYLESNKIKRINELGNHGFFVQLSGLSLEQILNLHKYDVDVTGYIYRKTGITESIMVIENYDDFVADVIKL